MHSTTLFVPLISIATLATAAVQPFGQCGGINYTGDKTCTAGYTCQTLNEYYSQCLQASTMITSTIAQTSATTSSNSTAESPAASSGPGTSSQTFKASMTFYGQGDTFGSANCQTNTAACGFFTSPGFAAAISENFYGAGPGQGQGPACGTCWKLTGQTDSTGKALSNAGTTIVVKINNLCPASGNPLCAQNGKTGTNSVGANVNFDLCQDSGAKQAFFGNDGTGMAVGTAVQVDCSQWAGSVVH